MAGNYETRSYRKNYFDYNQFFHPSICHVCKSTNQSNLLLCARCNMITYCSEQHRKIHEPQHKEICALIAKLIDEDPEWYTRSLCHNEWIESQKYFVQMIRMILTREMKPYEEQMFMYAKSCYMCHRRDNLYTCEQCFSFSYCGNHISMAFMNDIHNSFICELLTLTLKLDIKSLDRSIWKVLHVYISTFPNNSTIFTNMTSFCNQYFPPQDGDLYWYLHDHIFTDYVSGPLTLYNGLQNANLFYSQTETDTFNIHIIAANYVDRYYFTAWELFLRILNKTKKLIITMIGPELTKTEMIKLNVCCKLAKKELILQSFPLLYHDYVSSIYYKRPNVIVGFQAELNTKVDTWSKSIIAIQTQNCPLLLTARTLHKMQQDIIKILKVLDTSVKPVLETKNHFFSYRPYRDFETGHISYRNTYLIIYKNLNVLSDSSDTIQAGNSSHV